MLAWVAKYSNFNPPAPCGAGRPLLFLSLLRLIISIHPPLAGRDHDSQYRRRVQGISIHPPLAGRDLDVVVSALLRAISIHPPLAGRDLPYTPPPTPYPISIHPPLAGRDRCCPSCFQKSGHFNPPAPCGAGLSSKTACGARTNFNPPAPCGAGRHHSVPSKCIASFQSTRPLRGGTLGNDLVRLPPDISIHPPLAGRD